MPEAAVPSFIVCRQCQGQIPSALLACPACSTLVYADDLKRLATEAESAEKEGNLSLALTHWRQALQLLPPTTNQYGALVERIRSLSVRLDDGGQKAPAAESKIPKPLAGLGVAGLLLWKFKFVVVFLLTKAKLLLLGLTKASTFFSMFATFAVYWSLWGWQWALGFVLCIYVHEMGHVFALRYYGIAATAPMFIPGLGAFVRLKQYPVDVREDARIGLAGPVWGTIAAIACIGLMMATGLPIFGAIGATAAWLNLFNLMPVWQLDGGRGFRALSKLGRWEASAACFAAGYLASVPFAYLLGGLGVLRAFSKDAPDKTDQQALATYVLLVLVLVGIYASFGQHPGP